MMTSEDLGQRFSTVEGWTEVFPAQGWADDSIMQAVETTRALRSTVLRDVELVAEMPGLELLDLVDVGDVAPLERLPRLRGLSLTTWDGSLRVARLPNLEWLQLEEPARNQLKTLLDGGHAKLRYIFLGKQPWADLSEFGGLTQIEAIHTGGARLLRLDGIEACAGTLAALGIHECPKLESLDDLPSRVPELAGLSVTRCKGIADLSPVAEMKSLRYLKVDQKKMPSLEVLRGHPSLEFLYLGDERDSVPSVFADMPKLRAVRAGYRYHVPEGDWALQDSDELSAATYSLINRLHTETQRRLRQDD